LTVDSATPAIRQAGGERARRRLPEHTHFLGVLGVTAAMAAVYCVFSLTLQYTLQSSSYDMVIFDQAVRSYAHLEPGISIIKGDHNGFGPHFSVLGDHFSPIIALLAPFYWIYNGPQTLLVGQAVLFALAVPPLWVFTRRAFGGGRKATIAAYLVSVAYALSWPIAAAASFDFHEVAFAPVLTAVALERFQAGRLRTALLATGGLLLVKEDMGLFVAGLGAALIVSAQFLGQTLVRRQRLVGLALIVGGLLATGIEVYVLTPAFGGRSNYYWAYGELGPNVSAALAHIVAHPLGSVKILVTPTSKIFTYLWLLVPFCLLCVLSPWSLPVVPLLIERMLNVKYPSWWGHGAHYNTYLIVILVVAAVDGAARLDRFVTRVRARAATPAGGIGTGRVALACAAAMCALAIGWVPKSALDPALHPKFYHRTAWATFGAAAAAVVPNGVLVEAMNHVGPQLSSRDTVLLWDGDGTSPVYPPWVVASVTRMEFSFPTIADQIQRVHLLLSHGYQVVFASDGYLVMHAPWVRSPLPIVPYRGSGSTWTSRHPGTSK
jgi:uncharacterized membrane protein